MDCRSCLFRLPRFLRRDLPRPLEAGARPDARVTPPATTQAGLRSHSARQLEGLPLWLLAGNVGCRVSPDTHGLKRMQRMERMKRSRFVLYPVLMASSLRAARTAC